MTVYVNGVPQPEPEGSGNADGEVATNGFVDPAQQDPNSDGTVNINGQAQPDADASINGQPG